MQISVIIPTYRRPELLKQCLESLTQQDFLQKEYEIVICDDGSPKETEQVAQDFIKEYPTLNIKYFFQENSGPSKARNLGIKNSQAPIVAMTDDDCQPDRDWLSQIAKSFKDEDILGVGGVTYTQKEKVTPLTSQIENNLDSSFPTCNVAYRKQILIDLSGFDENFPSTNEDIDLAWRVEKKGKLIHNPKMRVLHPPRKDSFAKEIKGVKNLEGEFFLWEKLPDMYRSSHVHPLYFLTVQYIFKMAVKRLAGSFGWLLKNPLVYLKLFLIIVCQRLYLIILLPYFIWRSYFRRHAKN